MDQQVIKARCSGWPSSPRRMSHATYGKLWADANAALSDLYAVDVPPEKQKPERDRQAAFQLLATMFIKYVQIFRRLEQCYDQMVHPQKRRTVKKMLDGVIGRILEVKNEMINLELSEFQYFDDVLSDLKLTPNDIEMPIPKYFVNERAKVLKEREKFFAQILARIGFQEKVEKEEIKMTLQEAIRKIQVHERARQGRFRAGILKDIKEREERRGDEKKPPRFDRDVAAIKIQKVWRGVMVRRRVKRLREDEFMWLGMSQPPMLTKQKNTPQAIAQKIENHRRVMQEAHEQDFQQALVNIKEKLHEQEGPAMKEAMQDQIRQWFIECRDAVGKFPDYPDADDGGSASIFKPKDPVELARELAEKEEGGGKKKGSAKGKGKKSGKKDKKGKKSGKKGKKGKKGKDDEEDEGWKMQPSQFVPLIQSGTKEYETVWRTRDEVQNFSQKHDTELIKEEKRVEVEQEIRAQVDELMREELKNLKMAVDRDKGKKKKSAKKKKKKKKSGKKGKKKRKEKDLTPERTIESLFEELVTEGVIVKYPKVSMQEYLGEYAYLGTTLRQANIEPMPSLSDVRRVVTEIAILPLGSDEVHLHSPVTRSLLLAGPRGTGKNMLVNAICTEIGATLFDLTATNIAGKYPGKDGLKMLLHLIFKVGRALQPSIFLIDEAERMFKKKIPKTDVSEPKRLRKVLPKALKNIGAEDRIMLIGCTRCPWDGELKALCQLYQRIIVIPRPDYASRHQVWRAIIQKHNGIITNTLDVTSLTKVSDGYTMGHIEQICSQVLTERRVAQMSTTPLQAMEFVTYLAKIDPVYKEEETAFKDWYGKTPLGRKRARAAKAAEEEEANGGKGGKKGKKGGKGGKKKGKKK